MEEDLMEQALSSLRKPYKLRRERAMKNVHLSESLGMSQERFIKTICDELSEASTYYRRLLYQQAEYEIKTGGKHPYRPRSVLEYASIFNSADDDFDLIMSNTYNDLDRRELDLEGLAQAVIKSKEEKVQGQR